MERTGRGAADINGRGLAPARTAGAARAAALLAVLLLGGCSAP